MNYLRRTIEFLVLDQKGHINQTEFEKIWTLDVRNLYRPRHYSAAVYVAQTHTKKTELLRLALQKDPSIASAYVLRYLQTYAICLPSSNDDRNDIKDEHLITEIYALKKEYPNEWRLAIEQAKAQSELQAFQQNIELNKPLKIPSRKSDDWLDMFIAIAKRCEENPLEMSEKICMLPELMHCMLHIFMPRDSQSGKRLSINFEKDHLLASDIEKWLIPMLEPNIPHAQGVLEIFKKALLQHKEDMPKAYQSSLLPTMAYALKDISFDIQTKIMQALIDICDLKNICINGGPEETYWFEHDFAWMNAAQKNQYVQCLYEEKKVVPAQLVNVHHTHVLSNITSRKDKSLVLNHLFTKTGAQNNLHHEKLLIHRLKLFREKFDYNAEHLYVKQNISISTIMRLCMERNLSNAYSALESTRLYQYLVLDALLRFQHNKTKNIDTQIEFLCTASEWLRCVHGNTSYVEDIQTLVHSYIFDKPIDSEKRLDLMDTLGKVLLPDLNISLKNAVTSYNALCSDGLIDASEVSLQAHISNMITVSQHNDLFTSEFDLDV